MPRFDGRRGNAERLGDLGNVELFDLAQDENRTKGRRELVDRVVEHSPHLPAGNRPFRRHGHGAAHQHFAIILDDRDFTLVEQCSPALRGAGMHERIVDDDAGEPGRQRGSAREALDRRERLQIRALHRVLGILAVAQYLPRSAKQALVVALHDEAHGPGIAARDTGRELEIGAALIAMGGLSAHAGAPRRDKRADDCSGVRDDPVSGAGSEKKTPKRPRQRTATPLILFRDWVAKRTDTIASSSIGTSLTRLPSIDATDRTGQSRFVQFSSGKSRRSVLATTIGRCPVAANGALDRGSLSIERRQPRA